MLTLLTWLTLLVVAVIVVVLAVFLILTAVALIRANRNLGQVVAGLEVVRDNTAPLEEDLSTINEAAVALRDRLLAVDSHLQRSVGAVRES